MDGKQCTSCQQTKPEDDFYLKLGRRAATCKECHKTARRSYYARTSKVETPPGGHPCAECGAPCPARKIGGPPRKYCSRPCAVVGNAKTYPDRQRGYILARYGLTQADYLALLDRQDGKCAVCGSAEPRSQSGAWHVDHCHDTDKVRGLLCAACNMGIGQLQDDPTRLRAAAAYIERHRE